MATSDVVKLEVRNEKWKRYLICNQHDVSEIWNELELCSSVTAICDEVPVLEGRFVLNIQIYFKFQSILTDLFTSEPIRTNDELLGEELHCRTCLISFSGNDDYRLHYRDDLHRYNLKLKLIGKSPVSQDEFCEIEDGISSISGSDSEEDSSEGTLKASVGSPKIYFQNQAGQKMAVYRCLLHSKKVWILGRS